MALVNYTFFVALALSSFCRCVPVAAAQEQPSALDPQWLRLGHYEASMFSESGYRSTIYDADFFFSPSGAVSPALELEATVTALTNDPAQQCLFPARAQWLRRFVKLPEVSCPEFEKWCGEIRPESATLIFPTSFLNNPASAFGHTFLRLNAAGNQPALLSYAANFAAETGQENAVVYAFKGIFGGYAGFFSVAPYYQKVKQYSDLENRDIWELDLSLTKAEVEMLTKHIYELRGRAVSYFYFDENCSYQLLSLIEVARPSLVLSARFPLWVIPIDTIRVLMQVPGLVRTTVFRPSFASELTARISQYSGATRALAADLIDNPEARLLSESTLAAQEQAKSLELAYQTILYNRRKGLIREELADKQAWNVLQLRSALPKNSDPFVAPQPKVAPYNGHATARLVGGMQLSGGENRAILGTRFALHDALDSAQGYLFGSQIEFVNLDFAVNDTVRLERATIIDALSLSPRDEFLKPTSWRLNLGLNRYPTSDRSDSLAVSLSGGLGSAWALSHGTLAYAMLSPEFRSSEDTSPDFRFGIGPNVGVLVALSDQISFHSEVVLRRFVDSDQRNFFTADVGASFALNRNLALRTTYKFQEEYQREANSWFVGLTYYLDPFSHF